MKVSYLKFKTEKLFKTKEKCKDPTFVKETVELDRTIYRCAEVFLSNSHSFIFVCFCCDCHYYGFEDFENHIRDSSKSLSTKSVIIDENEDVNEDTCSDHENDSKEDMNVTHYLCDLENEITIDHSTNSRHTDESPDPTSSINLSFETIGIEKSCGQDEVCQKSNGNPVRQQLKHKIRKCYDCELCHKSFREKHNLETHINRHKGHKPHECDNCDKTFVTSTELKSHKRTHTGERPYTCEICGLSFKISGTLRKHYVRHTNKRNYPCSECDKRFYDSGLLKEHMACHRKVRSHICEICDSKFTRRKTLLQHLKLHSETKQYKCHFCEKLFSQRPGLVKHLKLHVELK